jgi:iron(III) transport system permease protein
MKNRTPAESGPFAIVLICLAILVVYPLWRILSQAFQYDGLLSLESIRQTWSNPANQLAFRRSLTVAGFGTLFSIILGVFTAWAVTRTDMPHAKTIRSLLLTPFLIPPFVSAIAWVQLLGPVGYVNNFLMWILGREEPIFHIYGPVGIILVMTLHSYPVVYLIVRGALEKMDATLEEAALMSGARKIRVLLNITLPVMAPAIAGAALLVFSSEMANFGVPAILGMSRGYLVLTTKIYEAIHSFGDVNNFSFAAALSLQLLLVATTALMLQKIYLGGKKFAVVTGKSAHPQVLRLGYLKWVLFGFTLFLFVITTVAPVSAITLTSLIKAVGLNPAPANWTLQNFVFVLAKSQTTVRAIRNSLLLAVTAATVTTVLGGLISYYTVRSRIRGRQIADFIGSLPYAIPGTVLGLAIILAWIKPVAGIRLYNTVWIIIIAYITHSLTLSIRTISASFSQVHESLEESARMSGANRWRSIRDVLLPLVKPGLIASWFLVFMPSLRELTLSILLWSVGNETIGVAVFNLSEGGQMQYAAAMGVILIIIVFTLNQITRKVTRGNYGF